MSSAFFDLSGMQNVNPVKMHMVVRVKGPFGSFSFMVVKIIVEFTSQLY